MTASTKVTIVAVKSLSRLVHMVYANANTTEIQAQMLAAKFTPNANADTSVRDTLNAVVLEDGK